MKTVQRYLVLLVVSITGIYAGADDLKIIRERAKAEVLRETSSEASSIPDWIAGQEVDGSWPDINYANNASANWEPRTHLDRLRLLSTSYHTENNIYYHDEEVEQAVVKGVDFWLARDPRSANWWWNSIGGPQVLADVLILMETSLGSELVEQGLSKLAGEPSLTGQNRVWLSELVIERGLLENSVERVASGIGGITETIVITDGEGIQVDGTFFQHGNLIYNGGYGSAFLQDVAYWGHMLRGTGFAYDEQMRDVLATLILDGTGWMIRYDDIDYSAIGREIARKRISAKANDFITPLTQMIEMEDSHQSKYQALMDHITRKSEEFPYIEGHKHFWKADYTINRRAEFLVSLNTFSRRTVGGELLNDENLQGFYLPFGTTLIYRNGTEYDNISPVWDWRRLPGTTVEQKAVRPRDGSGTGQSLFVGGVSNGKGGMSAFDLFDSRDRVSARKSWFFFDEGFVALGANILCESDFPVFTTLNQSNLRPHNIFSRSILISDRETRSEISQGERTLSGISWVYHDGVGYLIPEGTDVYLKNDLQTGSWGSINSQYAMDPISYRVFLLGIDHGPARIPKDYSYCVLPIGDVEAVEAFAKDNPIRILSNTKDLQAVHHTGSGLTGITFFTPGEIEIEPGLTVSTDTACIVLVQEEDPAEMQISVSNPIGTAVQVCIKVSGRILGDNATFIPEEGCTELLFDLPGGNMGGASVIQSFSVVLDSDKDGLRDQWELAYFDSLDEDGSKDNDQDRFTNLDEYISGTSPIDSKDFPKVTIKSLSSGGWYLTFPALASKIDNMQRFYSLQGRADIDAGEWIYIPEFRNIIGDEQIVKVDLDAFEFNYYRILIRLE